MANNALINSIRTYLASKIAPNTSPINTVQMFNRYATSIIGELNPSSLADILQQAESGNIQQYQTLATKMLKTDAHLFGCYNSRVGSVAMRDYQILSASEEGVDKEIADYVARVFESIDGFYLFKKDAYDAVPKGFSAHWIEWCVEPNGDVGIRRFHHVEQNQFRFGKMTDIKSDLNILRRLTDGALVDGVDLESRKWFVPIIKANSGLPATAGLIQVNAWMYLFKNFDVKSWMQFAERYYLPTRIGKYDPATATDQDKDALLDALDSLGQDASAMISKNTSIEFLQEAQKAATAAVHENLAGYLDKQNSKAVLGHTGAIDSTAGKLGGEDNANEVRFDLIQGDAMAFDYAMNDQTVKSLVNFKFGPQKKYPQFKTIVVPPKNRKEELDVMNNFQGPISKKHYYEAVGIPMPKDGDEIIVPKAQTPNPFFPGFPAKEIIASGKKKL